MGALTETTSNITEFSGNMKVAVVECDGATGTTNTVTIDEMSVVLGVVATFKAVSADSCMIKCAVDGTTTNQISVIAYEDDGATACTQNATDFYLIAVGY